MNTIEWSFLSQCPAAEIRPFLSLFIKENFIEISYSSISENQFNTRSVQEYLETEKIEFAFIKDVPNYLSEDLLFYVFYKEKMVISGSKNLFTNKVSLDNKHSFINPYLSRYSLNLPKIIFPSCKVHIYMDTILPLSKMPLQN